VDSTDAYLIDRNGLYFSPILDYLRHGQLVIDDSISPTGVLEEAKFFGIQSIIPQLEQLVQVRGMYRGMYSGCTSLEEHLGYVQPDRMINSI